MPSLTLIVHPNPKVVHNLINFFQDKGDQTHHLATMAEVEAYIDQNKPQLVLLNIHELHHQPAAEQARLSDRLKDTKIVYLVDYPDLQAEQNVRKLGGHPVFLKQPFSPNAVGEALQQLEQDEPTAGKQATQSTQRPSIRVPVRIKLTIPYIILALLFAIGSSYIISRTVLDTIEERFVNQLIEAGKLANDWIVNEENRLLDTLRLIAFTREIPAKVLTGDAEALREIILPVAVNNQEDAIEILDLDGVSLLSLRRQQNGSQEVYDPSRGENLYRKWSFVRNILEGRVENGQDKYVELVKAPWGIYLYVAGPILDEANNPVGVILVGKSASNIVRQIREDTLAHATIYDGQGQPLVSSLLSFDPETLALNPEVISDIMTRKDEDSLTRPVSLDSINYSEILGPLEIREVVEITNVAVTDKSFILIGVALAETFLARPSQFTRIQVFVLTAVAFLLVIALGIYLANRITRPLMKVVDASAQVAQGNLNVHVETSGNDEVSALAHSFNEMVSGLQEGVLYRDLLGRTVSPEVREQLRDGFSSGNLRLEGQKATATVLVSDIRGFTTISETEDSSLVMNWLNEYFGELVPVIAAHGGVVSKFEGDAVVAFFGVLPRPLTPQEGADQACQASLAMLEALDRLNKRRTERGDPPFISGIGLNTGPVTAGALGSADRLHYTVIGDTVNATARIEGLTRQFGVESSIVISQYTLFALADQHHKYVLEGMGAHTVKGKAEQLLVYRLQSAKVKV